jgi:hypothetical protein
VQPEALKDPVVCSWIASSGAAPVLVNVTVNVAVAPCNVGANVSVVGDSSSAAPVGAVPFPDSAAVSRLFCLPTSVTVNDPARTPGASGLKVTAIEHDPLAGSRPPQLDTAA